MTDFLLSPITEGFPRHSMADRVVPLWHGRGVYAEVKKAAEADCVLKPRGLPVS